MASPAALEVTVVGSADAFNSAGRAHACYLLEGGAAPVMVDFGATALMALRRVGRRSSEVGTFVFTHLHGDHIGGFPFLVIDALFSDIRPSLRCVGPIGAKERLLALLDVTYGIDILGKGSLQLEFLELGPHQSAMVEGLQLETFPADHMDPPELPLCLRFTRLGQAVAFSGDTALSDGLKEAMDGAAMVFAECTGLRHPIGRHCAWSDWEQTLPTLKRTGQVVLTHLGQDVRDRAGDIEASYRASKPASAPGLSFADDGLRYAV